MRYVVGLAVVVSAWGIMPSSAEEIELGVSVAALENSITIGSTRNDRPDSDRSTALIKEGESESPEIVSVIERNREDRERTVVMDR
jgi:hypothetical protein